MDLTQSRDDPHGVQRLLDILRRQQDASSTSSAPNPFASAPKPQPDPLASSSSDAALRRRTYASAYPTQNDAPFDPYAFNPFSTANPVLEKPPPAPSPAPASAPGKPRQEARELGALSFAESLPILARLAEDEGLMRRLRALREQQHALERKLAKEHRLFAATAERQFPHAKQRREEDDKRRAEALVQWDQCLAQQQEHLARAGVPTFAPTDDRRRLETQRKVLAVLVDMLDDLPA